MELRGGFGVQDLRLPVSRFSISGAVLVEDFERW